MLAACSLFAPADDELGRAAAHTLLGTGVVRGRPRRSTHGVPRLPLPGCGIGLIADILGCSITMADVRVARPSPRRAAPLRAGIELVADHGADPCVSPTCTWASPKSCVSTTIPRPRRKSCSTPRTSNCSEPGSNSRGRYRRAAVAEGDLAACLALLEEAEQVLRRRLLPRRASHGQGWHTSCKATSTRHARGAERNLSPDDELRYVTEFEHITLAIIFVTEFARQPELQPVSAMLTDSSRPRKPAGRGSGERDRDPGRAGAGLQHTAARAHSTRSGAVALADARATSGSSPSRSASAAALREASRPARPGSARRNKGSSTRSATASSTCCGCCAAISRTEHGARSSRCP